MKKTFLTIGLTALTTLGLLAGGVAIYNTKAPSDNKLTVSVGSDILFGKDDTSTQPDVTPVVEVSELEKLCKEQKMMLVLTLDKDGLINTTTTIKESMSEVEKNDSVNSILSNCGFNDGTSVYLGYSLEPGGALLRTIDYDEGVLLLYPVTAPINDCLETAFYYLDNEGSGSMAGSYYYNEEFSVQFWNNAPSQVDNLKFIGWAVTDGETMPELTKENVLTNEAVSEVVPENRVMFIAVYESEITGNLCTAQSAVLTNISASWNLESGEYMNQSYYYHNAPEDNKAGLIDFIKTLNPVAPEGYEFVGWSTEYENADAIIDLDTVDESSIGDLFAIFTAIVE